MTLRRPLEPVLSRRRLNLTRCLDYLEQMASAVSRTDCSPPNWLCSSRRQPPSYSAMTAQPMASGRAPSSPGTPPGQRRIPCRCR